MRDLLEHRAWVSAFVALMVGTALRRIGLWHDGDPVLVLIQLLAPHVYRTLYATFVVLLFSTPYLVSSVVLAAAFIFVSRRDTSAGSGPLPPYPPAGARENLFLILGERHHPTKPIPSATPSWLTIPARGLYTGVAVIGAVGSGKTSGCLYPYAEQILGYKADDPVRRIGGLVLEVKGDFCHDVRKMLAAHRRQEDYVEVSLDGPWRYNPLHNDLDAYALAYGIASLINNAFGKGKEPFWQQAYTNLVKFIILLHKAVDDYVTLFDVYACAIEPDRLAAKIAEGERRLQQSRRLCVPVNALDANQGLRSFGLQADSRGNVTGPETPELRAFLTTHDIPFTEVSNEDAMRREQLDAVKRWYQHDWQRIEPKLRTSIVEGIAVFLSLFDSDPALKRVFCPPKACYDPVANADGRYGRPLPPFATLIDQGKVCALNFPMAANPALARIVGTMMKQDFQRAVLSRIPDMTTETSRHWRDVLFLCDEYHAFATAGEEDPTGDEKFFSLSRQGKCIAIVATQSLSSLKSALPGDTWRTLLQTFRTKVFLALSDDVSARIASDLVGKAERLVPHYNLAESGQDARISMLTGRAAAHRSTISTSKSYAVQRDFVFEPKTFAELKNAQAIVLAYDGFSPQPPTYCYLKLSYLDRSRTYFEQVARGEV
ncbi:MAG: TraM recognition domain-containing protein [Gemmatimonadaceae bacterium]